MVMNGLNPQEWLQTFGCTKVKRNNQVRIAYIELLKAKPHVSGAEAATVLKVSRQRIWQIRRSLGTEGNRFPVLSGINNRLCATCGAFFKARWTYEYCPEHRVMHCTGCQKVLPPTNTTHRKRINAHLPTYCATCRRVLSRSVDVSAEAVSETPPKFPLKSPNNPRKE